jgi:hypothetical protein
MTRRNRKKEENIQDVNRFMHEVEEAMHTDNMLAFWNDKKYIIISGLTGLFMAVMSWQWYVSAQEKGFENQANALWSIQQNSSITAEKFNSLIEEGTRGYKTLAWFNKAEKLVSQGEQQKAIALYNDVIEKSNNDVFIDLAKLQKAFILMSKDIVEAQLIAQRLVQEESAFVFSAKELLAITYEKQGNLSKALKQYENIAVNPTIPQGMRARVQSRIDALNRT